MKSSVFFACLVLLAGTTTFEAAAQRRNTTPGPAPVGAPMVPVNTPAPPTGGSGLEYRNPAADDLIPVEADKRAAITQVLQATVVELLALFHESKQAHWNLRGPLYLPLHEKLNENAGAYRTYADRLAERVLQVGNPIDGRTGVIVATANLGEFPGGFLTDKQVLILMTTHITTVARRVRQRIEQITKVDEVTSSELQALGYELDKHVWQFRVHMQ